MNKGRSNYSFQLNYDLNNANNLIQSYLSSNGFKLTEKNGERFYKAGDALLGYRGFSYGFNGQMLYISVWLIGAFGDFCIEQNSLNINAMNYRNSLNQLFQGISNLNNSQMNYAPMAGQPIQNNTTQFAQAFIAETNKKQETMCEVGFWLSLFGLLISFLGFAYGILVYVMNFYFASQGLKTRKRNKAIATIVLSIISVIVIIFQLANA